MKMVLKPNPRENLAERIYRQLKQDIFDFRLLPADRFSENEIAERMGASRTPVREALFRLEREGYVEVLARSGWQVKPFDFKYFEELYDVRTVLECAAVRRLCEQEGPSPQLEELTRLWTTPRTSDRPRWDRCRRWTNDSTRFWWKPPAIRKWRASIMTSRNGYASSAGWISPSRRASTPPTRSTPRFSRRSPTGGWNRHR